MPGSPGYWCSYSERAEITLSERVVAANLDAAHYSGQLLERLTWATADAEASHGTAWLQPVVRWYGDRLRWILDHQRLTLAGR